VGGEKEFGSPHACQPPFSRERGTPSFTMANWTSIGGGTSIRDYLDPQYQMVGNAGWTKGQHNVKFGADAHRLHMNHNETQNATFNFNGGLTALNGGTSPNGFNSMADFLLGLPSAP